MDACEEILQRIPDEAQERFTEHFEAWYAEVAFKALSSVWSLISTAVLTIGLVVLSEVAGVRAMIDRTWGDDGLDSVLAGGIFIALLLTLSSIVTLWAMSMIDERRFANLSLRNGDISRVGNEFAVLEAMSGARRSLLEEMERDIDYQEELIARVRRRS